jgi:SAM-dependent methyltransferase
VLSRALTEVARLRTRAGGRRPPREDLIARHAAGRSFLDVGCMWGVDGGLCFAAEAAGASNVTGVDIMQATPRFTEERERRGSRVRFVQADVHDPAAIAEIGVHDVVWCSGVIYHAPHPLLTLQRLRELTGQTLLLATETVVEMPGRRRTCIFAPGRDAHPNAEPVAAGRTGYAHWYWGIARSAMLEMLAVTGWTVLEEHRLPLHLTVVARPD